MVNTHDSGASVLVAPAEPTGIDPNQSFSDRNLSPGGGARPGAQAVSGQPLLTRKSAIS
jgi:hypothetical protein